MKDDIPVNENQTESNGGKKQEMERINAEQDDETKRGASEEINQEPSPKNDEEPETPPQIIIPSPEEKEEGEITPASGEEDVHDERTPEPGPTPQTIAQPTGLVIPTSEEKTWAALAHLSILLNLITGFLGLLFAFIIYMVYKDKSRYIAYHSMQSLIFQLICWVAAGLLIVFVWAITIPLLLIVVGCCLLPIAITLSLVPLAALIYGVIGAIETSQGKDFKYWLIGDWVRGILEL